jgi:adenosine/AMP kinase
VPGIQFGLAFCEASGKCLVRWPGTDPALTEVARKNAAALVAGHTFIIFLGDGFYPLIVMVVKPPVRGACAAPPPALPVAVVETPVRPRTCSSG